MIRLITIKNFRSISNQTFKVEEITTFVGRNDAGKSNILRALNLFFNNKTDYNIEFNFDNDHNKYAPKYNQRAQEVVIELALKLPASYRQKLDQDHVYWRKAWRDTGVRFDLEESGLCIVKNSQIQKRTKGFPARSKIPSLLSAIDFEYIPATKDWSYFQNLQVKLYDSLANFSDRGLHRSASSFEEEINSHVKDLTMEIDKEFTGSNVVKLPKNLRNIFGALEFNSDDIPLTRRGDGIKIRHIPMILSFIASRKQSSSRRNTIKPQIWAFEEPENNVEFLSCFELNRQLISVAKSYTQVLITTHSPAIYSIGSSENLPEHIKTINYYVEQKNNETHVNTTNEHSLHGNMGFLQLIAPIIEEKKVEWLAREKEYINVQNELSNKINKLRLPQLFLEGMSDKRVFNRLLKAKGINDKVHIYVPSDAGNSASSASDRLKAFFLQQKHVNSSDKVKALIILDNDDAGLKAYSMLDDAVQSPNIKRLKLRPNVDLKALLKIDGLNVCTDLERLMPECFWIIAKKNKWLEFIDEPYTKLTEHGRKLICNQKTSFDKMTEHLSEHQSTLLNYNFTDIGKEEMSKYIQRLSNCEQLDELIIAFKEPLSLIETFLLPE
ncbi:ATP-binding protein [Shewanella sp. JNE10-2]|uniref:ATP-dependent nuclease n=2 Tax=unclassified Shewanella TaxID=196818 RepID=UPI00200538B3|nr:MULTISPECIES: AAA family ATPase [unclassified Shewanella]MCK7629065.1 ATP-binding protein [Shewanella sp. JNE9-1]MCK7644475.1 ATP-binding protein [Shewanella sp. JNE3-1]MCK7652368.1 ATP-binding protein [Shewanella sp. JNE4-1]UPO27571.1 ATP-binding protein [Shewanella sp. JNE10-2]UPO34778.1 ATP-binding protein [Shewanella sp. JNE7]